MELPTDEIHLWFTSYEDERCRALYSTYRSMLNDEERLQQERFRFERDRCRYLVTRVLVRTVLSQYARVAPTEWIFSANQYGRPYIAKPQDSVGFLFSISHTDGLVALGVSRNRPLGVDVENISTGEIPLGVADKFFAPYETDALHALPAFRQQFRFFEYWTLKESYIKARGMGLSIPLDEFWFDLTSEQGVELRRAASLANDKARWQFWQKHLSPDYLVAICAEAREVPTRLKLRCAVPLVGHEELQATWSRVSA